MTETDDSNAIWERKIRWLLAIGLTAAVIFPLLWANEVLTPVPAVAAPAFIWLILVACGVRLFAAEWRISFWQALLRLWRNRRS